MCGPPQVATAFPRTVSVRSPVDIGKDTMARAMQLIEERLRRIMVKSSSDLDSDSLGVEIVVLQ